MTETTTIQLTKPTKEKLDDAQLPGETYEQTVLRLLGDTQGQAWTKQEIREIVESVLHDELRGRA